MNILLLSDYAAALRRAGLLKRFFPPEGNLPVRAVTYDSREVEDGALFACKGAAFKKEYLDQAMERDIAGYLSETFYETERPVAFLLVSDIRAAMAVVANLFYHEAWRELKLIGITGTKGKTTTACYIRYMLDEYLQSVGEKPAAYLSSIDFYDGKEKGEAHLTTPEAFELHRHFYNAARAGLEYFVMEVSSQALKYRRTDGVVFDVGVFLNISEDHISPIEHSDFEDYLSAKLKLFQQSETAVVNLGAGEKVRVLEAAAASRKLVTFGRYEDADVCGYEIRKEGGDTCFKARAGGSEEEYALTMPGLFNVENALAAIAVCREYGIPSEAMREGLRKARSSGRMEVFESADSALTVIVDYAHNRLSFEELFKSVAEEYPGRRIVTVFGCPGGKAYNRRTELAEIAGAHSERLYLTAEDPGSEPVADISREIRSHVSNPACEVVQVDDRAEAIRRAVGEAQAGTVLLVTGKGCETYQKVGVTYLPYESDAYWAARSLAERERAAGMEKSEPDTERM